jgi:outer membrane protein OmpA-like peptidoglycan-associated protein
MMLRALLLGTVGALSLAGSAQAGQWHGWYIGLEGGASMVDGTDADFCAAGACGGTASFDWDTGWAVLATVGYGWRHWRIELEGAYRQNDMNVTQPGVSNNGDFDELSAMVNFLYEGRIGSRLSATAGVGLGVDRSHYAVAGVNTGDFEDRDYDFAVQGIVGLNYALTSRLDLTLKYRYLWVDPPTYNGLHVTAAHEDKYALDDLIKHTVSLGLQYDLYPDEVEAPPPPPPPPPPPAPKHFIIFFGFNKCNITAEADAVLSEAAAAAKSMGSASVTIVGHTDTVGSPAYNQKLSECRANAAESNLVGKGVPEGAISTSGRGETELMVQTGDGVKEPQNRRATVDLN